MNSRRAFFGALVGGIGALLMKRSTASEPTTVTTTIEYDDDDWEDDPLIHKALCVDKTCWCFMRYVSLKQFLIETS